MTILLPDQIATLVEKRAPRRSALVRIAHPDGAVTRFWTGIGPLPLDAADDLDPGATYAGSGVMQKLPSFKQMNEGTAQRIDFTFMDRHPAVVAMMAHGFADAVMNIAFVFFNDDWSLAGPAAWLWEGMIDSTRRVVQGVQQRRILSAVAGAYDRRRAQRRYWSNAGHQSRHPGDLICQYMSLYTVNTQRKWPT